MTCEQHPLASSCTFSIACVVILNRIELRCVRGKNKLPLFPVSLIKTEPCSYRLSEIVTVKHVFIWDSTLLWYLYSDNKYCNVNVKVQYTVSVNKLTFSLKSNNKNFQFRKHIKVSECLKKGSNGLLIDWSSLCIYFCLVLIL